jgi:hypothetical protein
LRDGVLKIKRPSRLEAQVSGCEICLNFITQSSGQVNASRRLNTMFSRIETIRKIRRGLPAQAGRDRHRLNILENSARAYQTRSKGGLCRLPRSFNLPVLKGSLAPLA